MILAAGCDKAPAKSDAELALWRNKYEELVTQYEGDVQSKLDEIDKLRAEKVRLDEAISALTTRLAAAKDRTRVPEAVDSEALLKAKEKDRQIGALFDEVDRLEAKLRVASVPAAPAGEKQDGVSTGTAQAQLVVLGARMMDANLDEAAMMVLEHAVNVGAEQPWVLFQLGNLHGDIGDNEIAAQWYERAAEAVEKVPDTSGRLAAKIYNNYGAMLVALGKPEGALPWYEKAVEIDERYATVHFNLGLLYDKHLDDADKAVGSYRRHVELGGGRGITARNAILELQEDGRPDEEPEAEEP
jgi:tetratricopeptide (TPR) repeat protein